MPTPLTQRHSLYFSYQVLVIQQVNKVNEVNSMTTNPTPSNNKPIHSLMKIALSVGVVIGSGIAYGFTQTAFYPEQHQQSSQSKVHLFDRTEYELLKIDMPLVEVRSILGKGIEISRSVTTATYVWENADGSKITVIFEGDKLKNKEQSGLK